MKSSSLVLVVSVVLCWLLWCAAAETTQARSSKWPAVRAKYLAEHPACEACGVTQDLEVHHVRPFHLVPSLELEPANLITLCRGADHSGGCHLILGHWHDFRGDGNPRVREDAAYFLGKIRANATAATIGPRPSNN